MVDIATAKIQVGGLRRQAIVTMLDEVGEGDEYEWRKHRAFIHEHRLAHEDLAWAELENGQMCLVFLRNVKYIDGGGFSEYFWEEE